MRKLIICLGAVACASQGAPPGGPPDTQAPQLLSVSPDSGTVSVKTKAVVFRFDEVISERPPAATTLGDLFIVSPRQGAPNVAWHRSEVDVKPRKGWLPNTTYTVTLLPGVADLRGNVRNTGASTFFSTGPAVDRSTISGTVYDLLSGLPATGAIIEARSMSDTTVSWITRADTTGAYRLTHLPARAFSLRADIDRNKNFGADPDDPVDTLGATASEILTADFFVAVRDSVAPRLASAVASDSVTLTVAFDRPADSTSATDRANYFVTGSDSSAVPIASVHASPRDTTRKRPATARALPVGGVTIELSAPLAAKKSYRLRAIGIRGMLGQSAPSEAAVSPRPAAAPLPKSPLPLNLPGGAVPMPIKHD